MSRKKDSSDNSGEIDFNKVARRRPPYNEKDAIQAIRWIREMVVNDEGENPAEKPQDKGDDPR